MKYVIRVMLWVVVILISAGAAMYLYFSPDRQPDPVASEATLLTLDNGDIVGYKNAFGVSVWQGIPFAQPPVGELRWKAPRPAAPWTGRKSALAAGPDCASQTSQTAADNNDFNGVEDCLYLNVYAPEGAKNLPVMYWIHGGANNGGSSSNPVYDGSQLAAQFDVVVVSINYRLTLFGWLSHPALRANAEIPEDASSNFGTLDQIIGLQWVQQNIAKFGGDSNKVTIFGESAGGWNVMALMASPLAKGLFQGAIVQSGGLDLEPVEKAENFLAEGGHQHSAREFINQLLIAEGRAPDASSAKALQISMTETALASYLRGKTTKEVFQAFRSKTGGKVYRNLDLIGDGVTLPAAIASDTLFSNANNYNAVPVMMGTNRDEMKLFLSFSADHVDKLMGIPIGIRDRERYEAFSKYSSDLWKLRAVDRLASVMREAQGDSVFAYRFDADDLRDLGFLDLKTLLGAAHAFEIPYVFGNFISGASKMIHPESAREARNALSHSMMSYWAAFAHYGKPGTGYYGKQLEWQPWANGADQDRLMVFDTALDDGVRMSAERLDLKDVKQMFFAEKRFADQAEHCRAYSMMFTGLDFVQAEFDALGGEGCSQFDG
jgi:para-nitrobenzyl esterase